MDLDFNYICKEKFQSYYPLDIQFYSYYKIPTLNLEDFIPLIRERIVGNVMINIYFYF